MIFKPKGTELPYVNPQAPATWLAPEQRLDSGGFDWSWCYVIFGEVPGYPHYRVSSSGRVWCCRTRGGLFTAWRQMTFSLGRFGRFQVMLRGSKGVLHSPVHKLVLKSFQGECPPGREGCHNNGDHHNNNLYNLRWDTKAANNRDKVLHGRSPKGERNYFAKVSREEAQEVIRRYAAGERQADIGKDYGIGQRGVSAIVTGAAWPDLDRSCLASKIRKKRRDANPRGQGRLHDASVSWLEG